MYTIIQRLEKGMVQGEVHRRTIIGVGISHFLEHDFHDGGVMEQCGFLELDETTKHKDIGWTSPKVIKTK